MGNNQTKIREALEFVHDKLLTWNYTDKATAKMAVAVVDLCSKALSAPPRNCDVGTAKEQSERFRNFCKIESSASGGHCTGCRAICYGRDKCEFSWAQLPYKKEGTK